MEDKDLELYIADLQEQGYSEEEIFETLDLIQSEGKTQELETENAAAVQVDSGAFNLDDLSSEFPTYEEQQREQHNLEAEAGRGVVAAGLRAAGSPLGHSDLAVEAVAGFISGVTGLAQGVADAATSVEFTIKDQLASLFSPEYAEMVKNDPELKAQMFDAMSTNIPDPAGDLITQYSQTATENIADGNWEDVGRQLTVQLAQATPSLIATSTGWGGLVTLGVSAHGSAFDETIHKAPEESSLAIFGTSVLKGGYELASEYVTRGILGKAGLVFGKGGKKAVDAYSRGIVREMFRGFNAEGLSEAGAGLAGHLTDYYVHGIELPDNMWNELSDQYLVGGLLGSGATTVGLANKQHAVKLKAEPKEKQEQDTKDASTINTMADAKKRATTDEELSVIDDVIKETEEKIKSRQKKHDETVADTTAEEADVILENTVEAERLDNITTSNPNMTDQAKYVYTERSKEHREKAQKTYEIVYEWPQTVKQSEEIKEEIGKKRKEIKQKEATLKKSENPNPASTAKLNEEKADLDSKEKGLNDALDQMRPTIAESKKRKAKAVREKDDAKANLDKVIGRKPVEEANKRAEDSQDDLSIITDPNIPDAQKERSWTDFFKTNKKMIDIISRKGRYKYNQDVTPEQVQAAIKQEVFDRLTTEKTEKGRKRKATYDLTNETDRNKFWNAVDKSVSRKFQEESDSDKEITDPEYLEEVSYFDGLLKDEVINQTDYDNEVKNLKAKYGAILGKDSLTTQNEEGDVEIDKNVEKAYRAAQSETGADNQASISKALEGTSIDKIFKDWKENTDKLYKLLPPEFHSKPEFQDGNPPIEVWEAYFSNDASGRKRKSRLKSKINEWINESFGDGASTEDLSAPDIMDGAFDFLEGKKTDVKKFLPLLGKLKKNFPGSKIIISKARMIEDFIEAGIDPSKADNVKGYTDGSTVVLNPDLLDLETPIHEFGHIWAQQTRSLRPDLYSKAEKLIKNSPYYARIRNQAKNEPDSVYYGYSESRIVEEAIAQGIGLAGKDMFEKAPEQSSWDKLKGQIWEFINARLGMKKVEDLTLDQFLKLAVTEIITGEQFISDGEILQDYDAMTNPDSVLNYKEMPPGTTREHGLPTDPVVELDYHGVRKTAKMVQELGKNVNKYYDDLKAGKWILWQTGKFGEASKAAGKFDAKLSAIAEAKFKAANDYLNKEGFRLKSVPGGANAYAIVPKLSFLENSPAADKAKVLKGLLNNTYTFKKASPYKKSKIDQKTREILNATKRDFALRGHTLNEAQTDALIMKLQELVNQGKQTQKDKNAWIKSNRDLVKGDVSHLINETSGVDAETITQAAIDKKSSEKRTFLTDLGKGKIGSAVSRLLSPDSNNDFYGLLYSLLPSGKGRAQAKEFLKETITDPLEDANYNQLEMERSVRNNYSDLRKKHGVTDKVMSDLSSVEVDGIKLTNSQVVKLYNYIKNPKLYKQLEEGGVNVRKMTEVLNYLDKNPKLKKLANEVPSIFAGGKAFLNGKLDEHGYKGVQEPTIVKPGPGAELDILARVYEGNIPQTAPYTPFTAVGEDTSLDIEKVFEGDGDFYSVMSGNLKERTGGGALRIFGSSLEQDINTYISGPLRTANYLDFARNASDAFSSKNAKAMDAAYGKEWGKSMRESLKAIITGKNRPANATKGQQAIVTWMNRSVGGIMFLNVRSGALQLLSTGNFAVENPGTYAKGLASGKLREAHKLIWESAWFEDRGKGRTGLEFDEVFGQEASTWAGRAVDNVIQRGYAVTKFGDKTAILFGGAPYVAGRLAEGATQEQALKEFIAKAEETQQSSRPERIGREQRSPFGRAILQFANTPMQYNRKMQKAFKDMTAKDATLEERGQAANKILYYGAIQNAIFTALQQAIWTSLDLEDEDDSEGIVNAINGMLDTIMRGSGIIGAAVSIVKNILVKVGRVERSDQKAKVALKTGLGISPALSAKARQLEKALTESKYPLSDGPVTVPTAVTQSANAVQFITNIPLERAIKKFEGINDLGSDDLNTLEKTLRVGGWDRYTLDKSVDNKKPF